MYNQIFKNKNAKKFGIMYTQSNAMYFLSAMGVDEL